MEIEDDLDILTALLVESEGKGEKQDSQESVDDLDGLFDNDGDDEEYKESVEDEGEEKEESLSELFGDVDDIEAEEDSDKGQTFHGNEREALNKSQEELQEELRQMQEKMQQLQQQLASQGAPRAPTTPGRPIGPLAGHKPSGPSHCRARPTPSRPPTPMQKKSNPQTAVKPASTPDREGGQKIQESLDFSTQLTQADTFKRKPRMAHQTKLSTSPEDRGPLVEIKIGSTFQPIESTSKVSGCLPPSQKKPGSAPLPKSGQTRQTPPPVPKDVAVEKYSGLRLRRPRVSSVEMDNKMADRVLIRLSQLPERLAREKLEDSDWVTFAVLTHKVTQQSNSSGKTFSIWKLNDLHNLEVSVSLLLFGEVHKEHWKTEPGTVLGLLNPSPMKQRDGYDGVSLSVDNPQKVLLMGEAQDYGTCKAMKRNGDPCSQIVNLYECQYCQFHVKAQYKKMSSKRAELQSSYSGKVPGRAKAKGGSLKERLCQGGFHYGGVSSAACATALTASKPSKPGQRTLDTLFVKGSAHLVDQAKRLAMKSGEVAGCSDDFKSLLSVPSPGALQLKKHLAQNKHTGSQGTAGDGVQSISASELLKQQKQKQQQLLEKRRQRVEEIQALVRQNSGGVPTGVSPSLAGRRALLSPKAASEVPKAARSPATPHAPTLGRGFSEGEDIVFFDHSPPPPPSLSAAKMAAMRKLRARGAELAKEDPNAVKRKRCDAGGISVRVEKNLSSSSSDAASPGEEREEPAQKKRREQLDYIKSEEFQEILNAKSRHGAALQAAEYQIQERYFDPLVKKEQMEEKMRGIREMKCRAVTCKKCKYTYFKPADRCVEESHPLKWHDALKRFFKCPCGQRAIALDRLPNKHCSNCGLFKWERDGMLKEKTGPKIAGELLQPRGEEQPKFLSSMK